MRRKQNPNQTRRHRLKGHDYSAPGYYFVTFGTSNGADLLGTIEREEMRLSRIGQIVQSEIVALARAFDHLVVDAYAIMPNHLHLLIYLSIENADTSVSSVVRHIKGRTAAAYRVLQGDAETRGTLWHKGYHDEVVRDDRHLDAVRRYIFENPLKWGNEDRWY
ncbi:MAG: transposase [Thermomicrobiales bacterium]|nr:transposase [Thermomicrobiales bacterium]